MKIVLNLMLIVLIAGFTPLLNHNLICWPNHMPHHQQPQYQTIIGHQNKMILFIIDFNSFMCPACLDSFLEFYYLVSPWLGESSVWGVLVTDNKSPTKDEETTIKIAAKKAKGFLTANKLQFPLIVDRFHIFGQLSEKGTAVILYDASHKIIKKYIFPLAPSQLKEIMGYIQD